jgi:NADH-quinone oxidoreductase subunit H
MLSTIEQGGVNLFGGAWPVLWALVRIIAIVAPLMICVAYLTLWERKFIGWTQPDVHGPRIKGF